MAIDLKNSTADDLLDRYDTHFPQNSILELRSGSPPGAENAATGTLLVSITLPATPWAAASGGSKAKSGTWQNTAAAAGTIAHYRLKNAGDTEREEGTVTLTSGGGDMEVDNTSVQIGQQVTVTTFTRTL